MSKLNRAVKVIQTSEKLVITLLFDPSCEMAQVSLNDTPIEGGNYWDFESGDPRATVNALKAMVMAAGKVPEIVNVEKAYGINGEGWYGK